MYLLYNYLFKNGCQRVYIRNKHALYTPNRGYMRTFNAVYLILYSFHKMFSAV